MEIKLPDRRLKQRSSFILEKLFRSPDKSLPATFGGRAELKAAYRFFNQDCVSPEVILEPHMEKTTQRIREYPTVLLVNDTTDINMSHMEKVDELGTLNDTGSPGCLLHVLKAFTPERLALGVVSAKFIRRLVEWPGKHKNSRSFSIEEKESYKWLEDYRKAGDIAKKTSTQVIYVADREADIYELFFESIENEADLLVRGNHDRSVLQSNGINGRLLEELEKKEPIGTTQFIMPAVKGKRKGRGRTRDVKGRGGREVKQEMRSAEVCINPSKDKKKKFPPVKIYALYLKEVNVLSGEKPINWLLLTTIKIENQEDAQRIVNFYLCRWGIETFFHVLKNGCQIEELQIEHSSRLLPCISMYLIVAWRIMYMLMLGRLMPEMPCDLAFEEDEWECAYALTNKKKPPLKAPTLGEMINMIAKMGGYLGRKSDGPPGPQAIWIGIQKLYFNTEGWSAHKNLIVST